MHPVRNVLTRRHLAHGGLLILAVSLAYYQVAGHDFVWDTIPYVLENPWLTPFTLDSLVNIFTEAHRANWQPLVWLSHALDFALFGPAPGAHHLVNLGFHALNSVLVYALVLALIDAQERPATNRHLLALLTALIFALHPQHVESVAWVVERKDVLYSVFTLGCYITYLRLPAGEKSWLPFSLFLLAILAKPMAIMTPMILVLFDLYPLARRQLTVKDLVSSALAKWPYLLVSGAVLLVTLGTQSMAMPSIEQLPLWARPANAANNTLFYVGHYLWPVALSPFYPYPEDANVLANPSYWGPGAAFIIGATALGFIAWMRGQRAWLPLLGFYLLTLLPVSGLVHVGPAKATDHYVYLATLPFALLTAQLVVWLIERFHSLRSVVMAVAIFYCVFLLAITHQQVTYWRDPLTLWSRVVTLHPDSAFAHRNLAGALVQVGDVAGALVHAERSLALGGPVADYVAALREELNRQQP